MFFKNLKNTKINVPALFKMLILKLWVLKFTFHLKTLSFFKIIQVFLSFFLHKNLQKNSFLYTFKKNRPWRLQTWKSFKNLQSWRLHSLKTFKNVQPEGCMLEKTFKNLQPEGFDLRPGLHGRVNHRAKPARMKGSDTL